MQRFKMKLEYANGVTMWLRNMSHGNDEERATVMDKEEADTHFIPNKYYGKLVLVPVEVEDEKRTT